MPPVSFTMSDVSALFKRGVDNDSYRWKELKKRVVKGSKTQTMIEEYRFGTRKNSGNSGASGKTQVELTDMEAQREQMLSLPFASIDATDPPAGIFWVRNTAKAPATPPDGIPGGYPVYHLLTHEGVKNNLKKSQRDGKTITANGIVFPNAETGHKISLCRFPGKRFGKKGTFAASSYFPSGDKNGYALCYLGESKN